MTAQQQYPDSVHSLFFLTDEPKTKEWSERVAASLIEECDVRSDRKYRIRECRKLYYNKRDDNYYDYVYRPVIKEIEDECGNITTQHLVPPAKVRHIPIIKNMLRLLISDEKERPLILSAFTTDADSTMSRQDALIQDINVREEVLLKQRIEAIYLQERIISMQRQAMEQAADNPQVQQLLNQLDLMLVQTRTIMERQLTLSQKELKEIVKYYQYEHKEIQELMAEKSVRYHIQDQRLKFIANRNFEQRIVTGHEIYFVDWLPGQKDPHYRKCIAENVFLPENEHVEYGHQHQWATEVNYMTFDNILSEFSAYIDRTKREELKTQIGVHTGKGYRTNLHYTPDGTYVGDWNIEYASSGGYSSSSLSDLFEVWRVFWKTETRVPVLYSKNKHGKNRPDFIKFITDKEAARLKNNPERMQKRGMRIEYRYRQDLYSAIRVGHTWIRAGKHPVQLRSVTDKTGVDLPYICHSQNEYFESDSLVWETKDIQELYDVLWYQKELLVVLAGVRGVIYDLSQSPDDMELDEVVYYMKHGVMPIQSIGSDGRPKNTSFNQFGTYDQSLSPAVQLIDNTLALLKEIAGELIGVTNTRQGIVKPSDQVGTSQLSYNQSSLATERYFQEHEDLLELMFSRGANLSKLAYANGVDRGSFINGDRVIERMYVPPGTMKGQFKIIMKASRKEVSALRELRDVSKAQWMKGATNTSQYLDIIDKESILEVKKLIAEHERLAIEMAQNNAQQEHQRALELEEQKNQLNARLQQMIEGMKTQREQLKVQVDQQRLKLDQMALQVNAELKNKEIDVRAASADHKTDTEAAVELTYAQLKAEEIKINNENAKMGMMLDTIQRNLELSRSKEKVKDT